MLAFVAVGVIALSLGLVLGFVFGKRVSLWCPACGGSPRSVVESGSPPVVTASERSVS